MISLILAVALSISSTNDYVFTEVVHTNFVGIGMGETFDYSILRNEDRCFLVEALSERNHVSAWISSELELVTPTKDPPGGRYNPGQNSIPNIFTLFRFSDFYIGSEIWSTNVFKYASRSSSTDQKPHEIIIKSSITPLDDAREHVFTNRKISRRFAEAYQVDNNASIDDNHPKAIVAAAYTNVYADIEANSHVIFHHSARSKTGYTQSQVQTQTCNNYPIYYDEDKGWAFADPNPINGSEHIDFGERQYQTLTFDSYVGDSVEKILAVYVKDGKVISRQEGYRESRTLNNSTPDGVVAVRFPSMPFDEISSVDNVLAVFTINRVQVSGDDRRSETKHFVIPVAMHHVETTQSGCEVYGCDINMATCFNTGMGLIGWRLPSGGEVLSMIDYPQEVPSTQGTGIRTKSAYARIEYSTRLLGFVGSATVNFHAKVLKD